MLGFPNIIVELNSAKKVRMQHTKLRKGAASVEIQKNGVIYANLSGHITEVIARKLMADTKILVDLQHSNQKPALLLIDVTKVTSQDSGARSAAKQIADFQLDKIAVCGKRLLKMVGQYILRSGGMGSYSKVFSTQSEATDWLLNNTRIRHSERKRSAVRLLCILAASIPFAAFYGWLAGHTDLTGAHGKFSSMNPVVALTLIGLCGAGLISTFSRRKVWLQRGILLLCLWAILFSLAVLAQRFIHIELNIDTWLFASDIGNNTISRASPLTALCAFMLATFLLFINSPRRGFYKVLLYVTVLVPFCVLLLALIGYCYDLPRLYSFLGGAPMPLNTMAALILLLAAYIVENTVRSPDSKARLFVMTYWPSIFVFMGIGLLTGFMWQQSHRNIMQDRDKVVSDAFDSTVEAIVARSNAYIGTLRDYKAFFASSTDVDAIEFDNYAKSAELAKHYPGVIGISFIRSVPQDQRQAFEAQMRKQQGALASVYNTFTIHPITTGETLFPLTFTSPLTPNSVVGFNLASDSVRLKTLEQARDSGDIAATSTIDLNAARGKNLPKRPGFFISIPIYRRVNHVEPIAVADRRSQLLGTVNAYVEDKLLFSDILKKVDQKRMHYLVTDASNGEVIYETPDKKPEGAVVRQKDSISIGGKKWDVTLSTTSSYGASASQRSMPTIIISGGWLFGLAVALLVLGQTRRRQQAYELASTMTEDLQSERNRAVTLQQKDEAVLASIGDAVFAIDTEGVITLFNKACERISGYDADEAIGKHYSTILQFQLEATGRPNDRFIREALAGKVTSMKNHTILIRKDGYRIQVADSAAPIYNSHGKMQGVIVVFRDVSKEYELDKAKTEFVSLASHQLRTPLSAINWYSEMLLDGTAGKINKDAIGYIREIYEGNQRMVELVNSLLDVSRLDLGKLTNNPEPTNIEDLAMSLERELQTMITSKQITLKNDIQPKLPLVSGDPKLLRMIVQNLLSNAVKYTHDKGAVTLTLRDATLADVAKSGLRSHAPSLFLSVSDNGYGIPEAQQSKIFSKLFRADNVRSLDVEGTGLGLYIVKEVVEKLGGKVWFESKESIGTTFYVVMPYKTKHMSDGTKKV